MEQSALEVIKTINQGGVGILPTDTIYGIVGKALQPETVARVYKLKNRQPEKPFVILISGFDQLSELGIQIESRNRKLLQSYWPGPVSAVLPCYDDSLSYLHRGTGTLAVRLPKYPELCNLIKQTGPLIATSANLTGQEPAKTIVEAKQYFKNDVDFYIDGGTLNAKPSRIIDLTGKTPHILR